MAELELNWPAGRPRNAGDSTRNGMRDGQEPKTRADRRSPLGIPLNGSENISRELDLVPVAVSRVIESRAGDNEIA